METEFRITGSEFIMMVKDRIFRVVAHNEGLAERTLINACKEYAKTTNEDSKNHWESIMYETMNKNYTIMKNYDYLGVREVIG